MHFPTVQTTCSKSRKSTVPQEVKVQHASGTATVPSVFDFFLVERVHGCISFAMAASLIGVAEGDHSTFEAQNFFGFQNFATLQKPFC